MADNSRHVVGGSSDQIAKASPTGVSLAGLFTLGAHLYPASASNIGLLRVGSNSGTLTHGLELATNNSSKLEVRVDDGSNTGSGATTTVANTWIRVGFAYTSTFAWTLALNGSAETGGGIGLDRPTALVAGDVFSTGLGLPGPGWARFNGRIAWAFFLTGIALTAAQIDTFLNNPQSLVSSYGPSGSVTANALKILWPMQCSNATEVDKSGVGNDGTYTGTTLGVGDGPSPSTPWGSVCGAVGGLYRVCGLDGLMPSGSLAFNPVL